MMLLRAIAITVVVYLAAYAVIVVVSSLTTPFGSVEVALVFLIALFVQIALIRRRPLMRSR